MARQIVDIGVEGNDGTGDSIRESFRKVNTNFQEIYAVVGKGGQITFNSLGDVDNGTNADNDYPQGNGQEIYLPVVAPDGSGIKTLRLASDEIDNSGQSTNEEPTVTYGITNNELILRTANAKVNQDSSPTLGGPLDAANGAIANVSITDDAVTDFNSTHQAQITLDDLVIDKGFADATYYRRQVAGDYVNIRPEPVDTTDYFKDFTINGNIASIPDHGITQGSTGAGWFYSTTGDAIDWIRTITLQSGAKQSESGTLSEGQPVYIRRRDDDLIEFYLNEADALEEDDTLREELRLKLSGGTGTQTIENPYFDPTLTGNWVSNEALPRNSVVRRQGDTMEGDLFLSDHPGYLAGAGTPNGVDDLQAVSKLYVDSQSTESSTSLFVSTQGSDDQTNTSVGRRGRSLFFAYKSVTAAARQAEAIQLASRYEPGPFMQDITYTEVSGQTVTTTNSTVSVAEVVNVTSDDLEVQNLVDANLQFIIAEVAAWFDQNISTQATTTVGTPSVTVDWSSVSYDYDVLKEEVTRIVNAAILDHLSGPNANLLSKRVGQEYFAQPDLKESAGLTEEVYESAIVRINDIVASVLTNSSGAPFTALQTDFEQVFLTLSAGVPDAADETSIEGNFDVMKSIVAQGVFSAPVDVPGDRYSIDITNGSNDFVDQGDPQNRDLRVGKVVVGKTSGAIGRIVTYTEGGGVNDDTITLDLLAPVEFVRGEQLEFGNATKERNISIKVESGIYYEDFPVRLPTNTSVVGDESRRCILRPKRSTSQSPWAGVYFYRDSEFDNLRGDTGSVTGIPDPNLPVNGTAYTDPVTGLQDGFFGRHYLNDPTLSKNVDDNGSLAVTKTDNPGGYTDGVVLIERNKEFVVAETIAWVEEAVSVGDAGFGFTFNTEASDIFNRSFRQIVDSVAADLEAGGSENILKQQGELFYNMPSIYQDATDQAISYMVSVWKDVLENVQYTRPSDVDPFIGANHPTQYTNNDLIVNDEVFDVDTDSGIVLDLAALLQFFFAAQFNPAKLASQVDCFLLNDSSMIRGITVQGHGAFAAVLDPEGQVLNKAPFVHTSLTFSQSINRQAFRGGLFIDGFCANTPLTVVSSIDSLTLNVKADPDSALELRKPLTPAPFYIDGFRYQVNDVLNYDPGAAGGAEATLVLDPQSGRRDQNGDYLGFQETIGGGFDITLQTPGSRTVETNDLALVNDLGYGVATANGGQVIAASTFTYYSYAGYLSDTGSQIRSVSGANSYGVNGIVAVGSDPNEVPDDVVLVNDGAQAARTFSAEVVLNFDSNISVAADDSITQVGASGTGDVVFPTNGKQVFLKNVTGVFNTVGNIEVNTTDSGIAPSNVDTNNYSNPEGRLAIHFYETEFTPTARGDLSYYHDDPGAAGSISRYQITTVDKLAGIVVDGHTIDDTLYTYTAISRVGAEVSGTGAILLIEKVQKNGGEYIAKVFNGASGSDYKVGDTFDILGTDLNGSSPTHDATVTVEEVSISQADQDAGLATGTISRLSVTGTINVVAGLTPQRSGQVFRANFSTSNDEFNPDGLLDPVPASKPLMIRSSRNFVFDRIRDTERLTIRPSTAINFNEQPEFTYRAISFGSENAIGNSVGTDSVYAGTDIPFDFIKLVVDNARKTENGTALTPSVSSTTLGNTAGDTTIAIGVLSDRVDIYRLNNNQDTDLAYRPPFNNNAGIELEYTNELPMIVTWQGKKHYAYNYREVLDSGSLDIQSDFDSDAHSFALVDLAEVKGGEFELSGPTTFDRLGPSLDVVIVRQVTSGATGKVQLNGVGTTVMKLYDLSGTFNSTNDLEISDDNGLSFSPLLDDNSSPVSINSIDIRNTNLTGQATGIADPLDTTAGDIVTLRATVQDGSPAVITVNISVVRATGHEFNDVGTGSYNDTNFPNVVLGDAVNEPSTDSQVQERDKGRVFYEATDQDGLFRVGRFFTVDQGTGIVTIAANIALSNVDGIGFRRGVVVTEFSTDTAMADNATDAVPTESAVRGYVSRRLGIDQAGNAISNPLGPSLIPANGSVAMTGNLSLGGFTATNLAPVSGSTNPSSAVPKSYVDSVSEAFNKFADMRDVEINTAGSDQFIGLTGAKIIYILTSTLSGNFNIGETLTNAGQTADYGTIVGRKADTDLNLGNILVVTFTPGTDTFNEVNASDPAVTIFTSTSSGDVQNGPFDEVINLSENPTNDVQLTVVRPNNDGTDPTALYNLQIKPNIISNSNISSSAGIAQSKLTLQPAVSANSAPTGGAAAIQSALGLSSFDSATFTVTNGWVSLSNNSISVTNLEQIPTDTVLGRSAGGSGNVSAVAFSTVVDQGGGLRAADFPYTDASGVENAGNFTSAGALTRVGTDDFTVVPITTTGGNNSLVKTSSTGRVVANDVAIGKDNSFVVLSTFNTNGLRVTTPAGGTILTSQGSTNPEVNIPGNLDIGATGVTQTTLQSNSGLSGEGWVSSDWARHSFIEAVSESGLASTGISIGGASGKSGVGQVGIVTAKTSNNTSPVPFLFSSDGVEPDINSQYDIGISSSRYRNLWISNVDASGTMQVDSTLTVGGTSALNGSTTVTGTLTVNSGNLNVSNGTASVSDTLTVGALNNTGNTTLGSAVSQDTLSVNSSVVTSVLPRTNVNANDSGLDLGSSARAWANVYATTFHGDGSQLTGVAASDADTFDGLESSQFLRSDQNDVMDAGATTILTLLCDNTGEAVLNLHGEDQGTGKLFVGQSITHGGGIEYNGDGTPATSGAGSDFITLFRRDNGTNFWTARNHFGDNDWEFRGDVTAATFTGNGSAVTNVNASQLDGKLPNNAVAANSIVSRDSSADISANRFRSSYSVTNSNIGFIMTQVNTSTNDYIRPSTPAQFRAAVTDGFYVSGSAGDYLSATTDDTANGKITISKNIAAGAIYSGGQLELRTLDGSDASMGFHRSGFTAAQLRHEDNGLILSGSSRTASADFTATGDIITLSDKRMKTNVTTVTDALGKICAIRGVTYNKVDEEEGAQKHLGVIAQELLDVIPEAVKGGPTEDNPDGHYSVAYGNIVGLLIEGIKEQQKQIDALTETVNKLSQSK